MDPIAQSLGAPSGGRRLGRAGLALPSAMFALVAVSVLLVGLFTIADLGGKAVRNRERSGRAMHVAEAGLHHVFGVLRNQLKDTSMTRLLRGWDNATGTADDTLLVGYGLPLAEQIPAAGKDLIQGGTAIGRYFVYLVDDPADPNGDPLLDGNNRIVARCRGVTNEGAEAVVNAVFSMTILPGIATDASLEVSASMDMSGPCGGIHANGILEGGGHPTIDFRATATGAIPLDVTPKFPGVPPIDIPELNPLDYCNVPGVIWKTGTWNGSGMTPGNIYCVNGNVQISGDFGSSSSPMAATIIATGSIEISGKPFFVATHPDNVLLLAGGDLGFGGDWEGAGSNASGLLYGGGHCYISGKPQIAGQLICKSKSPAPGNNIIDKNLISGDARFIFDCSLNNFNKRRILSWYQLLNS